MIETETSHADVVIIGAGPIGMTLALALKNSPWRVLLIDRRARGAWADDPRALALSHGSVQLLERLNAWNASASTAIHQVHISQRSGFGRTIINRKDYDIPALGYVMRYHDLAAALDARLANGLLIDQCDIERIETNSENATLHITQHGASRRIEAKLIVHAEGTPNHDPNVAVREYKQHAIVAEVRPVRTHHHRAWERFTPDGPLALLPLEQDYSVVFTVPPDKAEQLLALDDKAFLAALRQKFGERLDFVATGPRASFPLALHVRRQITQERQVWIGNSAQTLHPVSGQGFNLGLRDAWELAETLLEADDVGNPITLRRYARGRQLDRRGSITFTDSLARLFCNDLPPLRIARGLGLLTLDLVPPLRHLVAKRMLWGARAWP